MTLLTLKKTVYTTMIAIFSTITLNAYAQTQVTVDASKVLNDVSKKPLGINMNYLMDDSINGQMPRKNTTSAIQSLGTKLLRFPGGEKADNYLWSVAPWDKANPRFARTGYCDWPSGDSRYGNANWTAPKASTLDFDEFMVMSKADNAEPLIVVAYDAMYKPTTCGGTIPTKEQLLQNAKEWVRYANIKKGMHIKYWMIGNESYNASYNGSATPAQYRDDVIEFSLRMKAVDPTIKIIANGDVDSWWATVLPKASADIDFLGVSNYPVYQFAGGYDYYRTNTPSFMDRVTSSAAAIKKYAGAADKNRIKVITTEFNAIDWSGMWANDNDLGHALVTFEMIGEHLKNPDVEAALLWNTRWVNNTTNNNDVYDAINKDGDLEPNGIALSIFGNNLLDKMVSSTSTTAIRTFASAKTETQELNVYIINKETSNQKTNLTLTNYPADVIAERWEMSGTGSSDLNPKWTKKDNVKGNQPSLDLPAVSITLLKFKPAGSVVQNNTSGIQDINVTKTVLFPNPARTKVFIKYANGGEASRSVKVKVFAVNGQECYSESKTLSNNGMEINVANWARGFYIVTADDGVDTFTQKLVLY